MGNLNEREVSRGLGWGRQQKERRKGGQDRGIERGLLGEWKGGGVNSGDLSEDIVPLPFFFVQSVFHLLSSNCVSLFLLLKKY